MVGAPHVQLLGEAVLRSVRGSGPCRRRRSKRDLRELFRPFYRNMKRASEESHLHPQKPETERVLLSFYFFLRDKYARKKIEGTRAEPEKCIMGELHFSQVNRGIPLT